MRKLIFLGVLFIVFSLSSLIAQNRVDRPWQIQINLSGTFLKAFGETLSDPEVENWEISNWVIPGISVGYHLNRYLYFGYAFQPDRDFVLSEKWINGFIDVYHGQGAYHDFEARVSPFKWGLYMAIQFANTTSVDYRMDFQRIGEPLFLGNNFYDTNLEVTWKTRSTNSLGLGLGYQWVSKKGFSFNIGMSVPIISGDFFEENVIVKPSSSDTEITEEDLELFIERVRDERFFYPIRFRLNIGYNLSGFKGK